MRRGKKLVENLNCTRYTKGVMTNRTDLTRLTPQQQRALTTILNLRRLTAETGTRTTRAQNDVLRALNSVDIAAVANALAQKYELN